MKIGKMKLEERKPAHHEVRKREFCQDSSRIVGAMSKPKRRSPKANGGAEVISVFDFPVLKMEVSQGLRILMQTGGWQRARSVLESRIAGLEEMIAAAKPIPDNPVFNASHRIASKATVCQLQHRNTRFIVGHRKHPRRQPNR